MKILCLRKQQTNIEVFLLCAVVFYKTSSKDFLSLLEVVWKNTAFMKTAIRKRLATKSDEVSELYRMKIYGVLKK